MFNVILRARVCVRVCVCVCLLSVTHVSVVLGVQQYVSVVPFSRGNRAVIKVNANHLNDGYFYTYLLLPSLGYNKWASTEVRETMLSNPP